MLRTFYAFVVLHLVLNGFLMKAISTALGESGKASLSNYYHTIKNAIFDNWQIIKDFIV